MTADFYEDLRALSTDRAYAWSLRFAIGRPSPLDAAVCMPLVQGHVHLTAIPGVHIADRLAIAGTDGYLPLAPSIVTPPYSSSGSRLAFTATTPTLRGRDLRCAVVSVWARERVEEDLAGTVHDEACDCWYVGVVDDSATRVFFRGFGPGPAKTNRPTPSAPPRRGPRRASAIRILVDREYCQLSVGLTSLTPGEGGAVTTDRWGTFVVELSGPSRRTLRRVLGPSYHPGVTMPIVVARGLRGGTYTVRAHYTGDAVRRPSPPVVKQMRVVCG